MTVENYILVIENIEKIGNRIDQLSQKFYSELFHLDLSMKQIFSGNVVYLNRKFANMIGTFKTVKYIDKVKATLEKLAERHLINYGAQVEHIELAKQALLTALKQQLEEDFTPQHEAAWNQILDEIGDIMIKAMNACDRRESRRSGYEDDAYDPELLNKIGGFDKVYEVHQRFYDVMFDHPWLGRFFAGKNKPSIIRKQTEFMVAAFGGPNNYKGDTPAFVHMHMLITDEQADLREKILRNAILEEGLGEDIANQWLKMDHSFRESLVKKSADECVMKCRGQAPLIAPKPDDFVDEY